MWQEIKDHSSILPVESPAGPHDSLQVEDRLTCFRESPTRPLFASQIEDRPTCFRESPTRPLFASQIEDSNQEQNRILSRTVTRMWIVFLLMLGLFLAPVSPVLASSVLPAPASIEVSVDTWNRFFISWAAVPGATGYLLQRRADADSTWQTLSVRDGNVTQFYDLVQNGHLYTYRVQALKNGSTGAPKDSGEAAMLWPVGIAALPVSADKLEISWTLPSNPFLPASGYIPVIERRRMDSSGAGAWVSAGRAAPGSAAFSDTGLDVGALYEYRVRFDVGLGGSPLWYPTSTGVSGWTKLPAPTNLTATLASYGGALLAWTPAMALTDGNNAYGPLYTGIERSVDGGPFSMLTTLDAAVSTYSDTSITNGHVYRYRVRHSRSGAMGDWSAEARLLFVHPNTLTADAIYPDQVNLVWSWPEVEATVLGEAQPRIERRKAGETSWALVALLEPGSTEYRDQELVPDTIYNYRIQAQYPDKNVSPWYPTSGNGREVRTGIAFGVGFFGHALSPTMVRLEWDFDALAGKTVRLERYNAAGEMISLLRTASESSYTDIGLLPGTEYSWRLVILAPSGFSSAASDPLTVKTETAPTPANVRAVPATADRVVISWDYAYGMESGFEIWRKTTGTWTLVGETLRNVQSFSDTALPESGTAQWKVRAIRGNTVYSAFATTEVRRLDKPTLPEVFTGNLRLGRLSLSWSAPLPDFGSDAVYTLETRTGINAPWEKVLNVDPGSRSVTWFLMQHGARDFRIRADVQGLPAYSGLYRYTGRAPVAPEGLQVDQLGSRQVILSWRASSESLSGYRLYRTESGSKTLLGTLAGTVTRFEDTAVRPGAVLTYAVQSWNAYAGSPERVVGPVTIPSATSFTDLGAHGWAAPAINRLASLGIVSGIAPGRYAPAQGLTRAEYMKMLLAALQIPQASRPMGPVADVPQAAWYAGWMYAAWEEGILSPDSAGKLYPSSAITRSEMAAATLNACLVAGKELAVTDEAVLAGFSDQRIIPAAYRGAFAMMVGNGLISGRSGSSLAPLSGLTRAEAAVMINRLLLLP